jgi:hypothetical protein
MHRQGKGLEKEGREWLQKVLFYHEFQSLAKGNGSSSSFDLIHFRGLRASRCPAQAKRSLRVWVEAAKGGREKERASERDLYCYQRGHRVQGYLDYKKQRFPRTLEQDYA